jgi:hypothetical protein
VPNVRTDQSITEFFGVPAAGNARVDQAITEFFGVPGTPINQRVDQAITEFYGVPTSAALNVRVDQGIIEFFGQQSTVGACIEFIGNITGLYYTTCTDVVQTAPATLGNTIVWVTKGACGGMQMLTVDGGWTSWNPDTGQLTIAFSDGLPIQTVYLYPTGTNIFDVWASSGPMEPFLQTTI